MAFDFVRLKSFCRNLPLTVGTGKNFAGWVSGWLLQESDNSAQVCMQARSTC
jgi:hypothetical protein